MKDELGEITMKELATLRCATSYSYLTDDSGKNIKIKGTKKGFIKQKVKFEDYQHCLDTTQVENKMKELQNKDLMQILLEKIRKNLLKTIN